VLEQFDCEQLKSVDASCCADVLDAEYTCEHELDVVPPWRHCCAMAWHSESA
jgi:hypothetical protein